MNLEKLNNIPQGATHSDIEGSDIVHYKTVQFDGKSQMLKWDDNKKLWWINVGIKNKSVFTVKVVDGVTEYRLNGLLHHDNDQPARITSNGNREYYWNGVLHRENGPAKMSYNFYNNTIESLYYLYGVRHTPDLNPATPKVDGFYYGLRINVSDYDTNITSVNGLLHSDSTYAFSYPRIDYHCSYRHGIKHNFNSDNPGESDNGGTKTWWKLGMRHRDGDKPAVISNHNLCWYKNGLPHRDNNYAFVRTSGRSLYTYWQHGKVHRLDGPAQYRQIDENSVCESEFYIDDIQISRTTFLKRAKKLNITELHNMNGTEDNEVNNETIRYNSWITQRGTYFNGK